MRVRADREFEIGKAIEIAEGKDAAIIANGLMLAQALLAADTLEGAGISARVIDMHTVKPLDRDAIRRAAETGAIVVAEEHLAHRSCAMPHTFPTIGRSALIETSGITL